MSSKSSIPRLPQTSLLQKGRAFWQLEMPELGEVSKWDDHSTRWGLPQRWALWVKTRRSRKLFPPNYPGQQTLGYGGHEITWRALKSPSGQACNTIQWNMTLCVNPGISTLQNFSSEYCIPDHSKVCGQFSCHTHTAKWTQAFSLHPVHNSFRYISKTLLTIIPTEVLPQMTTATYSQFIFTHFSFRHCYFLLYCQSLWTYSIHSHDSSSHFLGTVTGSCSNSMGTMLTTPQMRKLAGKVRSDPGQWVADLRLHLITGPWPHPLNSRDPGASWKDVSPNFCEARTPGRLRDLDHGLGSPFTNTYELQVKILFL